jgi:hypothetical protein
MKKHGAFKGCKKGQLVDLFLKSGIDLKGKVPDEILKFESGDPIDPPAAN